jgi:hypothetical protein
VKLALKYKSVFIRDQVILVTPIVVKLARDRRYRNVPDRGSVTLDHWSIRFLPFPEDLLKDGFDLLQAIWPCEMKCKRSVVLSLAIPEYAPELFLFYALGFSELREPRTGPRVITIKLLSFAHSQADSGTIVRVKMKKIEVPVLHIMSFVDQDRVVSADGRAFTWFTEASHDHSSPLVSTAVGGLI